MRKLAREAVIFMLLGAVALLIYYAVTFPRYMFAEHGWVQDTWIDEFAVPKSLPLPKLDFTLSSALDGIIDIASTFFMERRWYPLLGFPAGLTIWALYRLVRFAVRG